VLGCTGMSSSVNSLQRHVAGKGENVQIIEPLRAAVYNAMAWVLAGYAHSKEAFKEPPSKKRVF